MVHVLDVTQHKIKRAYRRIKNYVIPADVQAEEEESLRNAAMAVYLMFSAPHLHYIGSAIECMLIANAR